MEVHAENVGERGAYWYTSVKVGLRVPALHTCGLAEPSMTDFYGRRLPISHRAASRLSKLQGMLVARHSCGKEAPAKFVKTVLYWEQLAPAMSQAQRQATILTRPAAGHHAAASAVGLVSAAAGACHAAGDGGVRLVRAGRVRGQLCVHGGCALGARRSAGAAARAHAERAGALRGHAARPVGAVRIAADAVLAAARRASCLKRTHTAEGCSILLTPQPDLGLSCRRRPRHDAPGTAFCAPPLKLCSLLPGAPPYLDRTFLDILHCVLQTLKQGRWGCRRRPLACRLA